MSIFYRRKNKTKHERSTWRNLQSTAGSLIVDYRGQRYVTDPHRQSEAPATLCYDGIPCTFFVLSSLRKVQAGTRELNMEAKVKKCQASGCFATGSPPYVLHVHFYSLTSEMLVKKLWNTENKYVFIDIIPLQLFLSLPQWFLSL